MLEQMKRARASEEGFTLIELLVVVAILAILAGVVVFAVQGISDKGQTSACKIDTRTMMDLASRGFMFTDSGELKSNDGEMTTVRRDGDRLVSKSAGDPEVDQLHDAAARYQDVAGLHVAVDHAVLVRELQRREHRARGATPFLV